jgi:glycosyltransferase involved in cell wall biosynthesis
MRVALVQSEAGDDGRALRVARALRSAGHDATLIVPQTAPMPEPCTAAYAWQAEGFPWLPVSSARIPPGQAAFPIDPGIATARAVADVVLSFDVAWFFEREWAMPTARERRFSTGHLPVLVLDTVPSPPPIPETLSEINRVFAQTYAAQHADFVFSDETTDQDDCIRNVESLYKQLKATPERMIPQPATSPAVTVCIPYFEDPEFLPKALQSLAAQTSDDFTVIVVDDGSTSAAAQAAFAACREQYAHRGWTFLRQNNASAGGARNRAAHNATTEFLIFLDSDDILMPQAVERFLRGALLTGDDCLVARNYGFRDDPEGPCTLLYDPPGNSLIGSMADDMHGGSCMIFCREAFLRIGGFTEMRGVGFEDYELHIRANLEGLRWDVLPDMIYRYRQPRSAGVSQSTSAYPNLARVSRWYQQRLQPYGLGQLPTALAGLYWHNAKTEDQIKYLDTVLAPRRAKPAPQGRELKLLLFACNFPYGMVSGWHQRVQALIRYFGSRCQVTLVTSMPREEFWPSRKEALTHLHGILGVEGSNKTAITGHRVPMRVREHYTDTYRKAVRQIPSDQYHAAIMDQIFMAEFRKDIDTIPVLTEHNIESRLLYQAADRAWKDELPLHYQNARAEAQKLEQYEDIAWADFPLRAAVSQVDRTEMDRRVSTGRTVVASNGADLSKWMPNPRFAAQTVLFAGHLAYLPNVDAVELMLREIWPLVRKQMPHAKLIIAGRDPSPVVRAAVQQAGTSMGIELVPSPESMDEVAKRASITVAPLRLGSGTRCKILESMAWGLPVVSTTIGAEGIDVIDGEHLLIRDDSAAFAEAMVQLLSDEQLWRACRENSGQLVRERYSWDRVFDPLNEALLQLIP